MQRWLWVFVLVVNGVAAVLFGLSGDLAIAVVVGLIGLLGAYWISPWKGGRSVSHDEVMARPPEQRDVVIYWRPGCRFCAGLKQRLGSEGKKATWVNIWQDRAAATFVRSVNKGNETVPTVVLTGQALTNPDADLVLAQLSS